MHYFRFYFGKICGAGEINEVDVVGEFVGESSADFKYLQIASSSLTLNSM